VGGKVGRRRGGGGRQRRQRQRESGAQPKRKRKEKSEEGGEVADNIQPKKDSFAYQRCSCCLRME
jgi:hypothetical protein